MKYAVLGNLCKMQSGGTPRRGNNHYYGGKIPWVKIGDIDKSNGKPITQTTETITKEGLESISNRLFSKGTLLLAMYGSVGKTAFAGTELSTNQAILGINIKDESLLDYSYLKHWFDYNRLKILKGARGATLQNISATIVKGFKIPLPPLPEQKRIAQILDKADTLRQKNKQLLATYDELLKATFLDMFGDPANNQKGLPLGTIRDLVDTVNYGTSSKAEDNGEFPYLRMNNITYEGAMDFSDLKYINLSEKEKPKYIIKKGDLLFNRTNSKELVGKTAVYREKQEMVIAGYIIRVRANDKANTDYISAYLNSKHGKAVLRGLCKSIVGMANINAQELQKIKILIPPISIQNQFAQIVENIEAQKAILKQSIQQCENLFNALVQKAFKSEL
ncbi:MAG: restriction endonuclease subunit S [Salinivirgaceae bacterium]